MEEAPMRVTLDEEPFAGSYVIAEPATTGRWS